MSTSEPKVVGTKLLVDGFVYVRSRVRDSKTYWDCRRLRSRECRARAVSMLAADGAVIVIRGPLESTHSHPANEDECKSEEIVATLKRHAEEHPEQPPAQILRTQLSNVHPAVINQLPERDNLKRAMRRQRRRDLPPNPKTLQELPELPERYKNTLIGETFLLFDSGEGEDRVLVFATRRNIELLYSSDTWFLDGTFKVHKIVH